MKTRYKILDKDYPYFVTLTVVEWIPVFTKQLYFEIVSQSLVFCREQKKFLLHGYVIVDNHIHLIISGQAVSGGLTQVRHPRPKKRPFLAFF